MELFVVGISFKTAPVAVRERMAVCAAQLPCYGCRLKVRAGLGEVVLLSTCNRVEVYGTSPWIHGRLHQILSLLCPGEVDLSPHFYLKQGIAAAQHLFAVTSGLDSMVLGETEITGQVKHAYEVARQNRLTGRVLNRLFQTALQVGKAVRTDTSVGRGAVSVGSVAVELAGRIFDQGLAEKTVMIIGAGRMGEACIRHLAARGARSVLVSNRSLERAQRLAAEFGGRAVCFSDCFAAMREADIVVSSTGCPDTVVHSHDVQAVMRQRPHRPLFLIDIAVPRDIAPEVQHLDNVYLYNIDALEAIVRENLRLREKELHRCHAIIAQRAAEFLAHVNRPTRPVLPDLKPELEWAAANAAGA